MLPFLRLLDDGKEHTFSSVVEALANHFKLTEHRELIPGGNFSRFSNRVGWTRKLMKKARLIEAPLRGRFRMSDRGRDLLKKHPQKIDIKLLEAYPEFVEFRQIGRQGVQGTAGADAGDEVGNVTQTPEELLESTHPSASDPSPSRCCRVRRVTPILSASETVG